MSDQDKEDLKQLKFLKDPNLHELPNGVWCGTEDLWLGPAPTEYKYKIILIDSCEYISSWVGGADGGPFLTHKGNCKNHKK